MEKRAEELARELFEIKRRKAELREEEKALNANLSFLTDELVLMMDDQGIESFKTPYGSISKKVSLYPSIEDWDRFINWVKKTGSDNFLMRRANQRAFKEYFEETGEYPDGLDAYPKVSLNTRKSS